MSWLEQHAEQRRAAGLHRTLRPRESGRVDIASNDYLGLARDHDVIEAGVTALRRWGAGATGSRLVSGHTALHAELESALSNLVDAERTLVFSSGYLANLAAITALTDADTLLLSDAYNHASIVDACRLSRAAVTVYPNRDVAAVREALAHSSQPRKVIVTDAVFSVDGDLAPLAELADLATQFGALLVVDEAHSIGVLGHAGAGACSAAGVLAGDVVRTFTLSKSLGSQGGAIAATGPVVEHLINTARSFIFDTGLAPAAVGSALAATSKVLSHPELPEQARAATRTLAARAASAGWTVHDHDAAVASIPVGRSEDALLAQRVCADAGVDVGCFRPPSVPDGIARLRMTGHADLSPSDFDAVEKALRMARDEVAA
ncbi:MAG: 8-amino-7-oxononanoate synthase [Actinobacteria bacterium]|nr:8-amino-7-oxononanoate synthase [Actinomycetota bacterium]MCB9428089.1 8-amino-7-oxononanoate synthase [Actinomycetota bacterium]MCO5299496.1 8-amino-7-oxononanoate synthase [Candidatus Nanopelagicales bacterium]HPJ19956.1 8-amino-7-oxononanoate synthase [Actinomycetota bacterium]HRV66908.1 8-amino-7-oxononanoate synthase [Candidatus Nanopelagicales bacterium]